MSCGRLLLGYIYPAVLALRMNLAECGIHLKSSQVLTVHLEDEDDVIWRTTAYLH